MAVFTFNLIDRPWVPGVETESGRPFELSLREVLSRAPTLRELADPSPLVTAALHRFLLALLHRALDGPASVTEWADIWEAECFPMERINAYLDRWHDRFDLFDPEHPFYQTPEIGLEYAVPVNKLAHERAAGNNDTLFDHSVNAGATSCTPAEAARLLLAQQAFALQGTVSLQKGEAPALYKSAAAAPTARGALLLVRGDTLFHTLMLNLVRYCPADSAPFETRGGDQPAWERDQDTRVEARLPDGYLDYLTWQSRRIRLRPDHTADGAVVVTGAAIMKGNQLPPEAVRQRYEPAVAFVKFVKKEDAKPGKDPWPAIGFTVSRAMWRNSQVLVQSVANVRARPRVLDWVNDLIAEQVLPRDRTFPVDLLGLSADKAKVLLWRHERLPLPLVYLDSPELVARLAAALGLAEEAARALRLAARLLASLVLAPRSDHPDGPQPDPDAVSNLARSFNAEQSYWAALEQPFNRLLLALPEDASESAGVRVYGARALPEWWTTVSREARRALTPALDTASLGARSQKAAARAEIALSGRLRRIAVEAGMAAASTVTPHATPEPPAEEVAHV